MPKKKTRSSLDAWTEDILSTRDDVQLAELYEMAAESVAKDNGLNKINKQLSTVQSKLIEAMKERENSSTPELQRQINRLNIQIKVLEEAIEHRRHMHRERSYFLEQKVAEAGIFSVPKSARRRVASNGQVIRKGRNASIRYAAGEELTPFDARVLMSVHKLWENKGKSKEITLNMYEILKVNHLAPSGEAYNMLEQSLMRLFRAEIMFEESSAEKESRQFGHLLQEVGFERGRAEVGRDAKFTIMFTDRIYNSMQAGYLERISGALWEDLSSSAAQLLLPILPGEFRKGINEWNLEDLCRIVNVTSPRPAERKGIITKALKELELFGEISGFKIWDDYSRLTKVHISPPTQLLDDADPLGIWRETAATMEPKNV